MDYDESGFGSRTLKKDATSFTFKVKIDPNSFDSAAHYPRFIMLGTEDDLSYVHDLTLLPMLPMMLRSRLRLDPPSSR